MDFFVEIFVCFFKFYTYHCPIAESLPGNILASGKHPSDVKKTLFNFVQYIKFIVTLLRNIYQPPTPISCDTCIISSD